VHAFDRQTDGQTDVDSKVRTTTWRLLILYSENSSFGVIMSWLVGRVSILLVIGGSGQVRSQKIGPVDIYSNATTWRGG